MSDNVNESLHEPTETTNVTHVTFPEPKTPERLHFVQGNDEMSDLERLALAISVWLVLVCTVALLGWLTWD